MSDKKTPSMNPYHPEPNLSNRRASISINSTPKNELGNIDFSIYHDQGYYSHIKENPLNESLNISRGNHATIHIANRLNSSLSKGKNENQSPSRIQGSAPKEANHHPRPG